MGTQVSCPQGMLLGELALPLALQHVRAGLEGRRAGEQESRRAGELALSPCQLLNSRKWAPPLAWAVLEICKLTSSATTQVQIHGLELAYPNIYLVYELLEHVKGLVLQNQSCRISMTQDNSKIPERSPGEDPVLMVEQKPETSDWTKDSLQ